MIKLHAFYVNGEIMGDNTQNPNAPQQEVNSSKVNVDNYGLILAKQLSANHDALKRKLLKKFWNNIYFEIQTSKEKISADAMKLILSKLERSTSVDDKLDYLKSLKYPLAQKAFKQAIFDIDRANQIKGGVSLQNVRDIVAVADKLKVDYPSKYATQHKTKAARKREVEFVKKHYHNKSKEKALTRIDVIRLIKLADFNKQPRDLSGLNLTDCDLRGLDLRKTKFDDAKMTGIMIDQVTKFKGSTFAGVTMNDLKIHKSNRDGSPSLPQAIERNSLALRDSFQVEYEKLRSAKVNRYGSSIIKNYFFKQKNKTPGEAILCALEHGEHSNNRSRQAFANCFATMREEDRIEANEKAAETQSANRHALFTNNLSEQQESEPNEPSQEEIDDAGFMGF